ncbi:MAG: hypothetical protein ACPG4U_16955 [Pseudomonadales bacterium]
MSALEMVEPNSSQQKPGARLKPSSQLWLGAELNEISGLEQVAGRFWGINDSGNGAKLFAIDPTSGAIAAPLRIQGVNNDWEELARDSEYLYIADTGNNFAIRSELSIYKVALSELAEPASPLPAKRLNLRYADRKNLFPSRTHNYDSEALVSVEGELWLFSKNRVDKRTKLYKVDLNQTFQQLSPLASYPVNGLITAADYNPDNKALLLLGYSRSRKQGHSFIWRVDVSEGMPDWSSARTYRLSVEAQWESILWQGRDTFVVAAEKSSWAGDARLATFRLPK